MINTSNWASKDNLHGPSIQGWRPRLPAGAAVTDQPVGRSAGARARDVIATAVTVTLDWLAYFLRRWGDRWFAMNDTEAYWWGWQITKAFGGLIRRYRDTRFDTLAACARYAVAGTWADGPYGQGFSGGSPPDQAGWGGTGRPDK